MRHSEETKRKISLANKGRKPIYTLVEGNGITEESRRLMSEAKKGSKHPRWKGGITSVNNNIRHSLEYKLWRTAVFERDNYTCIWCGARNGNGKKIVLNADHIKPFAYYPELRFAIDNGRTLCVDCHRTTDTYGKCNKKTHETQ